jgi:hypothetical protein
VHGETLLLIIFDESCWAISAFARRSSGAFGDDDTMIYVDVNWYQPASRRGELSSPPHRFTRVTWRRLTVVSAKPLRAVSPTLTR